MAFQPEDFDDLVRYLDAHPDLRDQLRRRILSDEFLRLPMVVQELAEGFGKVSASMDRAEAAIDRLTAAQQRTGERLDRLEAAIVALTAAQDRTDAAVLALTAAQQRTEERVDRLAVAQERMDATLSQLVIKVDGLTGVLTESQFRERVPSYYGKVLRRPRAVPVDELELIDRAMEAGVLTEADFHELLRLDVVVRGTDRRTPGLPDTLFALEVSATIDAEDVVRAIRRAAILERAGYRAFPSVGGRSITARAMAMAEEAAAVVMLHEAR